jgi:FMN reductase
MSPRRIVVVSAGLGQPSSTRLLGDRLAAAATRALGALGQEAQVEVVELRRHAHDLANNLLTGFPSGELRRALDAVQGADALIAVTPVFNASYSGLFKTFFDVLERGSLEGVPVLLAATGGSARHSLVLEHAMRPLFAYLRALTLPTGVYAATEDWGAQGAGGSGSATTPLGERIDRAGAELAQIVAARPEAAGPEDPFENITSFEQLLGG